LTSYLEEAGIEGLVLDTPDGQRSGNDLEGVGRSLRAGMRTLMHYALAIMTRR
jgi:DNA gyrase subunit B